MRPEVGPAEVDQDLEVVRCPPFGGLQREDRLPRPVLREAHVSQRFQQRGGATKPADAVLEDDLGILRPPPFREESNRQPIDAVKALLAAGADPNAKAPDGAYLMHQAVAARQVEIIRALAKAGAKFDVVNKDNLTPLQLAEKPEPPPPPGNNTDSRTYRPKRDSREDVIAAVRELMGLGPNDPTPQPPPAPPSSTKRASSLTISPSRVAWWRIQIVAGWRWTWPRKLSDRL